MIEEIVTYRSPTPASPLDRKDGMCYETLRILRLGELAMNANQLNKDGFRTKTVVISAFQWRGDTMSAQDVPPWAKLICRDAMVNDATDPPGLVMQTLKWGDVRVPHNGWFVHSEPGNIAVSRTDFAFNRDYEPNE